ncbi:MAG TPA: hypothetical protein VHZ06_04995 [Marmoricola sp.]|jgi:hypothetical protein|nr:hypothetical protein [Marmoricola sp.]
MRHLKTLLTVIGAVTILVLAGNTVALAASGHGFLLGKTNRVTKLTTLTRTTSGPALQVTTKSSANPPFAVNGTGKVTHLNADLLDGKDSTALGTRAYVWTASGAIDTEVDQSEVFVLNGLPAGTYLVNYEVEFPHAMLTTGFVDCGMQNDTTGAFGGQQRTVVNTSNSDGTGINGAGLMTSKANGDVRLTCAYTQAAVLWHLDSDQPLRITAIPLSSVTNKGVPPLS